MPINDIVIRPAGFIATESFFEIISFFITLIISIYSYKIYKVLSNKRYLFLSAAFLSMAIGFLFGVLSNFVILYSSAITNFSVSLPFIKPSYFYTGSLILFIFFNLSGYIILASLAAEVRGRYKILALLVIALLCAILVRQSRFIAFFYFFAFLLLILYIVPYMYKNYKKQKSRSSYLVFMSFFFLAVANFLFIGISLYDVIQLYILGHTVSLLGYIALLLNLLVVVLKK